MIHKPSTASISFTTKTDTRHPDHTLITYPDQGHLFYPSSQWRTAFGGPIEPKVLEDLFGWLSDPVRGFKESAILSLDMR